MRVPQEVRNSVVFLGERPGNSRGWALVATGFVVDHAVEGGDPNIHRCAYVVTARHCVRSRAQRAARINTTDGRARMVELPGGWWVHPSDATTDVAVMPLPDDALTDTELFPIPTEMFAGPDTFGGLAGEGDEVFTTGLFAEIRAQRRNMPVVRTGNLALLASELDPVPTEKGHIVAHLIEARSMGGQSGSPAFMRRTVGWEVPNVQNPQHGPLRIVGYGPNFFLLGLVHGHWELPIGKDRLATSDEPRDGINMGIALVVPASKILETLNHPDLVSLRRAELEQGPLRPVVDRRALPAPRSRRRAPASRRHPE